MIVPKTPSNRPDLQPGKARMIPITPMHVADSSTELSVPCSAITSAGATVLHWFSTSSDLRGDTLARQARAARSCAALNTRPRCPPCAALPLPEPLHCEIRLTYQPTRQPLIAVAAAAAAQISSMPRTELTTHALHPDRSIHHRPPLTRRDLVLVRLVL